MAYRHKYLLIFVFNILCRYLISVSANQIRILNRIVEKVKGIRRSALQIAVKNRNGVPQGFQLELV